MQKRRRLEGLLPAGGADSGTGGPFFSCRRVTRMFGALAAVNKLSFDVEPGIVFGIGGPNGAGKTTLFDVICGLSAISGGEIVFKDKTISGLRPFEICHAGIARTFQLNAAFQTMTVRENVLVAAQHGIRNAEIPRLFFSRSERSWTDQVLEMTGLSDSAEEVVSTVSLLKQKLLMIAAAYATRPALLLLDEPVGGLVPSEIDAVEAVIRRLTRDHGVTVMLIEHVMRFLVGLSDQVMIMHHGEMLFKGAPGDLAKDRRVVETYLGEGVSALAGGGSTPASVVHQRPKSRAPFDAAPKTAWHASVEASARQLVKQYRSGRLYPIDFMRLERLLSEIVEGEPLFAVAKQSRILLQAHREGGALAQPFESLALALDEAASFVRPLIPDDSERSPAAARAEAVEDAARRLLATTGGTGELALEDLRRALGIDPQVRSSGTHDGPGAAR